MDGYAIREDVAAKEFSVVGEIRAGQVMDQELRPGEAIRIFTGARLPAGGMKVIIQEHVPEIRGKSSACDEVERLIECPLER